MKIPKLTEGKIYTFYYHKIVGNGKESPTQRIVKKKRMRLIKCYRHHALFENPIGIRQSFIYWDLARLLSQKDGMAL